MRKAQIDSANADAIIRDMEALVKDLSAQELAAKQRDMAALEKDLSAQELAAKQRDLAALAEHLSAQGRQPATASKPWCWCPGYSDMRPH